jgi:hypothetical protein
MLKRSDAEKAAWMKRMMVKNIETEEYEPKISDEITYELSDRHTAYMFEHFNGDVKIKFRKQKSNKDDYRDLYLTISRFIVLESNFDLITDKLDYVRKNKSWGKKKIFELHLGGKIFVTITAPFETVDIRFRYMEVDKESKNTRYGVNLDRDEWVELGEFIDEVKRTVIDYHKYEACIYNHNNNGEVHACDECRWGVMDDEDEGAGRDQWHITTFPPTSNNIEDEASDDGIKRKRRDESSHSTKKAKKDWSIVGVTMKDKKIKMKVTKSVENVKRVQNVNEAESNQPSEGDIYADVGSSEEDGEIQ